MKIYVIQDHDGTILSLHRTPDGVAHFVAGHGDGATMDGVDVEIDAVDPALAATGTTTVSFADKTPSLRVGYHAVLV